MSKKTPAARPPSRPSTVTRTGFVDTMAASQQAHIDQLVQQSRTLQHAVNKLHEEFSAEQKRGQQVVQKIQEQWHVERLQWQEGCDTLQACHKLEYLRLTMDLEREQDNVLKERNLTRLEKVARLQRDFKITMFQARESELERQVEDLTQELQNLTASKENEMAEKESSRAAALKKVKAEYAEYVAQAEADAAGYAGIEEERDRLQEELGKLREEHARLKVSSDSSSTRLERVTLQLEGSKTTIAALQQKNDELVRNVADLQHQLGKWQNLDVKGVEEIDIERKKRVESETRLMQLQGRLDQAERKEAELSNTLEKEKRRTEKAKEAAVEWKAAAEGYEGDLATFEDQVAQLQNEITQLQTDLETERAISRPARARRPTVNEVARESEDEEIEISPPQRKPASKVKKPPNSKPKEKPSSTAKVGRRAASPVVEVVEAGPSNSQHDEDGSSSGNSADEVEELTVPSSPVATTKRRGKAKANEAPPANGTAKKPGRGKAKAKAKPDATDESDVEVEEAPPQAVKRSKGKQKAAEQDSDIEVLGAPQAKVTKSKSKAAASKPAAQTRTRKRKVSPDPDGESDVEVKPKETKQKGGKRAGSVVPSTATKPGKNKKRTPSPLPPDETPPQEVQPKKKRKINLFPTTQAGSSFDFMGDGLGGGLGIPTELSPIKDTQAVPSRSVSGIGNSFLQSRLVTSITRRR